MQGRGAADAPPRPPPPPFANIPGARYGCPVADGYLLPMSGCVSMKLSATSALAGLLCGLWPLMAAGSVQDFEPRSASRTGIYVMTNEHGEVLYKSEPQYEF